MNDVEVINTIVANNLVTQRKARGLTLDQLSQASGISRGMVVQIEQGRTNPSVATLCRLANALAIPISRLIEPDTRPTAYKAKLADATELWHGNAGGYGKLITGFDKPSVLEFWEWKLNPQESYDGIAHPPGARELLFVNSGSLTVSTSALKEVVGFQESLVFDADVPHRYANEHDEEVVFMMVVVEPRGGAKVL